MESSVDAIPLQGEKVTVRGITKGESGEFMGLYFHKGNFIKLNVMIFVYCYHTGFTFKHSQYTNSVSNIKPVFLYNLE